MVMGLNEIHNMDCIRGMNELAPGSVDLAFADPPFNIGYKYDVYEDRRAADEYLNWTKKWGTALVRALKPDGSFWLAIGDDFAAELKLIFQRDLGLICRSWVIWYYTFGVNCQQKFSRSHTHLFHFVKNPKSFTFNADEIRVPSARQLVYADNRADSRGRLPDDTWILRPQDAPRSFNSDEDVWYFPRVCGTFKERAGFHGCQMPEQLLARIIRTSSNVGELVLEPFGGSGTTLIVAKKLGRQFVGFELSKNYADRIEKRLKSVQPAEALAGAADPKTSVPSTSKGKGAKTAILKTPSVFSSHPIRGTREEVERGIIEAFLLVRDGWSVDRVVSDPDFNAAFLDKCRTLGVAGPAPELNRRLMALRKANRLEGLPRSKRISFAMPPTEIDRIEFALEIAMQKFKLVGQTLDAVICDPKAASAFDEYVHSMIPQSYPSFVIRTLGLRLRKRENDHRIAGSALQHEIQRPDEEFSPFDPVALRRAANTPGIYWLWSHTEKLYVGSTLSLNKRLDCQFTATNFDFWGTPRNDLRFTFAPLHDVANKPIAHQSKWIARWNPVGNYENFAIAG
jgi:DNA modification methylase